MQIHADVSGLEYYITSDHSVALGCAIAAAYATGDYPSLAAASLAMVKHTAKITPNMQNHAIYQLQQQKYHALYKALKTQNLF